MRIAVLLSAGRHPVSGAAVLPRLEAQAIRIAAGLGRASGLGPGMGQASGLHAGMGQASGLHAGMGQASGLHAGSDVAAVAEALGLGLGRIEHVVLAAGADPVPALAARLGATAPDLVLAGRRGQGGEETGMVPYALAALLGLPLIPDIVAAAAVDGDLILDRSLGRGARLKVRVRGPVVATVHPEAPAPLAYAFGQARRGTIDRFEAGFDATPAPTPAGVEERPYRRRPRLVKGAPAGGSAAERLKAATGESGAAAGGRLLVDPDPEEAAREILGYLRRIGVVAPPVRTRE